MAGEGCLASETTSRAAGATSFRFMPIPLLLACGGGDGPAESPTAPARPDPVATSITISPEAATLGALGETAQLRAQVLDQNGRAIAGATVTWSSSDDSVATVTDGGLVTAVANGSASVMAAAASLTADAAITVAQQVAQVQVSPAVDTLVALEDTLRLSAAAMDPNQHRVPGVAFTWESNDTTIASVRLHRSGASGRRGKRHDHGGRGLRVGHGPSDDSWSCSVRSDASALGSDTGRAGR